MVQRGRPATTQDKLNATKKAQESSKPPAPKKPPRNPSALPPPAEYAAMLKDNEARRAQKEKDRMVKKMQRTGATTTAQKLEKTRHKATKKASKKTEPKTSLMAFLDGLGSKTRRGTTSDREESTGTPPTGSCLPSNETIAGVLYRPTARTRSLKADRSSRKSPMQPTWSQGFSTSNDLSALRAGQMQQSEESDEPFRFLDLPPETRQRVYRHAVVQENSFVWPVASGLDWEQPDLAMVNRLVRQEVLRVFYSQNRFAFTLSSMHQGRTEVFQKRNEGLTQRWLTAMTSSKSESGQWLKHIQKLAFEGASSCQRKLEFVICVTATTQLEEAADHEDSVERPNKRVQVEIHRQASCILPRFKGIVGPCEQALMPDGVLRVVNESLAKNLPLLASSQDFSSLLGGLDDVSDGAAVASCIGDETSEATQRP